jgi:hypothetical protein
LVSAQHLPSTCPETSYTLAEAHSLLSSLLFYHQPLEKRASRTQEKSVHFLTEAHLVLCIRVTNSRWHRYIYQMLFFLSYSCSPSAEASEALGQENSVLRSYQNRRLTTKARSSRFLMRHAQTGLIHLLRTPRTRPRCEDVTAPVKHVANGLGPRIWPIQK